MRLYAIYVVYLINKLARLKLLPGFICLLLCVFLLLLLLLLRLCFYCFVVSFCSIIFSVCCLSRFLWLLLLLNVFFFLNASFDLSLIPLCLFPLDTSTARVEPKQKRRHFTYSLYFLSLAFRIIAGSARVSAGGVSRRFSSDASPDLAATEARLAQSKRFYATAVVSF